VVHVLLLRPRGDNGRAPGLQVYNKISLPFINLSTYKIHLRDKLRVQASSRDPPYAPRP
jgi:hypothetical protein